MLTKPAPQIKDSLLSKMQPMWTGQGKAMRDCKCTSHGTQKKTRRVAATCLGITRKCKAVRGVLKIKSNCFFPPAFPHSRA